MLEEIESSTWQVWGVLEGSFYQSHWNPPLLVHSQTRIKGNLQSACLERYWKESFISTTETYPLQSARLERVIQTGFVHTCPSNIFLLREGKSLVVSAMIEREWMDSSITATQAHSFQWIPTVVRKYLYLPSGLTCSCQDTSHCTGLMAPFQF